VIAWWTVSEMIDDVPLNLTYSLSHCLSADMLFNGPLTELPSSNPDLWPSQVQMDTLCGAVRSRQFGVFCPFGVWVRSPYGTDRQTDGRTGKTRTTAYYDGRHNKRSLVAASVDFFKFLW